MARARKYDMGHYAGSIQYEGNGPIGSVKATDPKSRWMEFGTGIFGPTGRPIRARSGGLMHFDVDGQHIAAREIRGQAGGHVMRDAGRIVSTRLGVRFRWLATR